ncbi:MAG: hypothetical protein IPO05_03530 [Flavobacteriales bacterium]|nr:hypothetical protein [Flavobacteriales bacterium]
MPVKEACQVQGIPAWQFEGNFTGHIDPAIVKWEVIIGGSPIHPRVIRGIHTSVGVHTKDPIHGLAVELVANPPHDELSAGQLLKAIDRAVAAAAVDACGVQVAGVGEPDQLVEPLEAAYTVAEQVVAADQHPPIGEDVVVAALEQ